MNNTKKNKILFNVTMILLIIFAFSNVIFADNEISNETTSTNETNTVRPLTLEEQQNQIKEQLTNANQQLEYVEEEISSKLVSIARIQDRISEYKSELDKVNLEYTKLQVEVAKAEKELQTIQEQYDKKDKALREKLVAMYERGTSSYIDVLLNSKTVLEFISNYFVIQTIVEYDSKQMIDINRAKQQIEQMTMDLQNKKAKAKLLKVEAETQSVIWENTKTILENEKANLDETEQTLLSNIDIYKKQEAEINRLIANSIYSSTYQLKYSGGIMIWPTVANSYITSQYGSRLHPIQGIVKNHDGIDIGATMGEPIYATQDGIIIYYGWMGGYGKSVMIDHGINDQGIKIVTLYGHGSEFIETLDVGSKVKQGDVIMKIGSTGNSTGPHLHFEVRENGVVVDPKKYLSNEEDINNEGTNEIQNTTE